MKKRKQRLNPLADARRSDGYSAASQLWHRKAGIGYDLFLQYYANQPIGTVCGRIDNNSSEHASCTTTEENNYKSSCATDSKLSTSTLSIATATATKPQQGPGLSRASKRRRKRRKGSVEKEKQRNQEKSAENVSNKSAVSTKQLRTKSSADEVEEDEIGDSIEATTQLGDGSKLLTAYQKMKGGTPSTLIDSPSVLRAMAPFVNALSKPLPLTFRLRYEIPSLATLEEKIKQQFSKFVQPFGNSSSQHTRVYQGTSSTVNKSTLSKLDPTLKSFLVEGSMNGTLARQELGSMIPVLALEAIAIKASDFQVRRVLDLCASPGSKTLQVLELMKSRKRRSKLVANDVNPSRLEALKEAVNRSSFKYDEERFRVNYTNFDASRFPIPKKEDHRFDFVICDVPCSGDGTIRKDAHILPSWKPDTANALHGLQCDILRRALQVCRPGGLVSYSTCSLNPVEDEAVVAAVLQDVENAELVEIAPYLVSIGFSKWHLPGLSSWRVAANQYSSNELHVSQGDDVGEDPTDREEDGPKLRWISSNEGISLNLAKTLWPPQDASKLHLTRCYRLLPQFDNCGGFFVAVIRKG